VEILRESRKGQLNIPKTVDERPICGQENFSYGKPQIISQFLIRYSPLRLNCVKLFKLRIEGLKPAKGAYDFLTSYTYLLPWYIE
jgi:hypothetical protein